MVLTASFIAPVTDIEPAPSFIEDAPDESLIPDSPALTGGHEDVVMKEVGPAASTTLRPTTAVSKLGMSHDVDLSNGDKYETSVSTGYFGNHR